jgi:hypothetical protein
MRLIKHRAMKTYVELKVKAPHIIKLGTRGYEGSAALFPVHIDRGLLGSQSVCRRMKSTVGNRILIPPVYVAIN